MTNCLIIQEFKDELKCFTYPKLRKHLHRLDAEMTRSVMKQPTDAKTNNSGNYLAILILLLRFIIICKEREKYAHFPYGFYDLKMAVDGNGRNVLLTNVKQ